MTISWGLVGIRYKNAHPCPCGEEVPEVLDSAVHGEYQITIRSTHGQ